MATDKTNNKSSIKIDMLVLDKSGNRNPGLINPWLTKVMILHQAQEQTPNHKLTC